MFVHGFMHKRCSSAVGGSKTPNDGSVTVIELHEEEEERQNKRVQRCVIEVCPLLISEEQK